MITFGGLNSFYFFFVLIKLQLSWLFWTENFTSQNAPSWNISHEQLYIMSPPTMSYQPLSAFLHVRIALHLKTCLNDFKMTLSRRWLKNRKLIVFKQRSETVIKHMMLIHIQNVISKANNSLAIHDIIMFADQINYLEVVARTGRFYFGFYKIIFNQKLSREHLENE